MIALYRTRQSCVKLDEKKKKKKRKEKRKRKKEKKKGGGGGGAGNDTAERLKMEGMK